MFKVDDCESEIRKIEASASHGWCRWDKETKVWAITRRGLCREWRVSVRKSSTQRGGGTERGDYILFRSEVRLLCILWEVNTLDLGFDFSSFWSHRRGYEQIARHTHIAGEAEARAAEAGAEEARAAEAEAEEARAAETEAREAEEAEARAAEAEAGEAEAGEAEAGKAEAGKAEARAGEAGSEEAGARAAEAEPGEAEAGEAEAGKTEAGKAEAEKAGARAGEAEAEKTRARAGEAGAEAEAGKTKTEDT